MSKRRNDDQLKQDKAKLVDLANRLEGKNPLTNMTLVQEAATTQGLVVMELLERELERRHDNENAE